MNHLVMAYGYYAVALFVGAESLGVPLPGETILIVAAIYAGHTHLLSVWIIFAVAAAAAILGDNIGFLIGDKGGYRLLRRYGHYVRIDEPKLKIGRYIFDRHGGKVVFFGRFVSVLRTYAAFLAGANRMRWPKFLVYNAAGGIVWAAAYTFAAYGPATRSARHPAPSTSPSAQQPGWPSWRRSSSCAARPPGSPSGPRPPTPVPSVAGTQCRLGTLRTRAVSTSRQRHPLPGTAPTSDRRPS